MINSHSVFKMIERLSKLGRSNLATSVRDEIDYLQKELDERKSEWCKMAGEEYAVDRIFGTKLEVNLSRYGWTKESLLKALRNGTYTNKETLVLWYTFTNEFMELTKIKSFSELENEVLNLKREIKQLTKSKKSIT